MSIHEIESKARTIFEEHGYSEQTTREMLQIVRAIVRLHHEQGKDRFECTIVNDFINRQETRFQGGEIAYVTRCRYKKIAKHLLQIAITGTIITTPNRVERSRFSAEFENVLADILAHNEYNLKHRKRQHVFSIRFFNWLYSRGYCNLSHVNEHSVCEYLTDCSKRMGGSALDGERIKLKHLLVFLSPDGILPETMTKLFLFKIRKDTKIMPFMPQDDISAVLNVIDRSSAIGKRDYAMILLAAVTGLRCVDVCELSLGMLDWRNGEIRLIQEKTDNALALPLTTDVGESIRDYILNGRPDSDSDKIFLRAKAPFDEISKTVLGARLQKYCIEAGLAKQWTSHSLRRSVATNMVTSGVSVITTAQVLGHRSINSTKQYISLDSVHLKECALNFDGIPVGGVVQ
jgi:site-specific recombinase XerD